MSPNYFFTSDHHFDHKNIIKYCNRPFSSVKEMNETMIARHNEVVSKNDIVIVAGDFSFASTAQTRAKFINQMNGTLIFLMGSHDRWLKNTSKIHEIWHKNIDSIVVVVGHYAMRTWPLSHYGSYHLYGHSHGKLPPEGKSWDIGVDTNNFYPYSWDEIKQIMLNRPNNTGTIIKSVKG